MIRFVRRDCGNICMINWVEILETLALLRALVDIMKGERKKADILKTNT